MEMIDSHGDMFTHQINVTDSRTFTDPTVNKTDAFSITFLFRLKYAIWLYNLTCPI